MIEVLKCGILCSVQDMGREGYRHFGVPVSGAMDHRSALLANLLLDNDPGDAVLEIDEYGVHLLFDAPTWIAESGATRSVFINKQKLSSIGAIEVKPGDIIKISSAEKGRWSYIAVKGGILTDVHLGSRSSYPPAALGTPYLRKRSTLPILSIKGSWQVKTNSRISLSDHFEKKIIRAVPGPEYHLMANPKDDTVLHFKIDQNSNRMAYLLKDRELRSTTTGINTAPVFPGTVQLPPSGVPVVLMRDAQTTGGYPRILQILSEDMDALAQKRAGDEIQIRLLFRD